MKHLKFCSDNKVSRSITKDELILLENIKNMFSNHGNWGYRGAIVKILSKEI